ncbi:MAG: A/G-specific adenine glycosylase, partial [Peptococcaceae bacterium]|nr:A/G-specific adenine glycosylase [Peptococcaceae bacterium]
MLEIVIAKKECYEQLPELLLPWFAQNARILPWRADKEPYHIWLSEIMLQQTRVEAVKGYYQRFLDTLPDIKALAEAPEDLLLKLWEGLGYYSRVRNLQKAAKVIMQEHNGVFPSEYEAILKLPGIGTYTAGAIGSICFDIPEPAVDGNVLRIISRITENYSDVLNP